MFQATMSGCWPNYAQTMIDQVHGLYVVFWIVYVAVVVFAVTRIISGYFFLEAMASKQNSTDLLVAEQSAKRIKVLNKLNELFKEADKSGDGLLDRDEFEQVLGHPEVRLYLQSLELDIHEEKALFQLIDDGDDNITYAEFINGVMRLKGQARSLDVVAMMRDLSKLRNEVSDLAEVMTGVSRKSRKPC
jgi:Ca2+-binding EF-hand superfamily protein